MNDMLAWRKSLPAGQLERTRLARPINRMGGLTLLARLAMNITSEAHGYAVHKLVKTVEQAEQLKQDYDGDLPVDVETVYQSLTDRYLALMEAIPHQFAVRLLAELEQDPIAQSDDSLVSKLYRLLGEWV
jgi:hypothetical protein